MGLCLFCYCALTPTFGALTKNGNELNQKFLIYAYKIEEIMEELNYVTIKIELSYLMITILTKS